jgi:hypothetical protein
MRTFAAAALLLCLGGAVLSGCSGSPTDTRRGSFDGVWDGAEWRGHAYAVVAGDTLHVVAHRPDSEDFYDEYIRVRVPLSGPGTYDIPSGGGELAKIIGGDAGYFPPAAGTLVVKAYSPTDRIVSGTLSLVAHEDGATWEAEGTFTAPLFSSFQKIPWERRRP